MRISDWSSYVCSSDLALAHRPDEFRAFFAYHDALMDKPGNLTKAEREMIVVATSNANQCQYCVVAHGAILRIRRSEEHTSELQSLMRNSYAVFCLKKKNTTVKQKNE